MANQKEDRQREVIPTPDRPHAGPATPENCQLCARESRTMSRRGLVRSAGLGAGGVALSVAALRLGGTMRVRANDATPATGETHTAHWTYEGAEGPEHWGELDPSYASCSGGTQQSPIDLAHAQGQDLADLDFTYAPVSPIHIINNGHTVQVNVPAGNAIVVDGTAYELQQFHFHTPSEHSIDGKTQAMELHLVHKVGDEATAVVGLLLQEGAEHVALKPVFEAMPVMAGPEQEVKGTVDLAAVLPATRTTFRYTGSLTTPPCTEGVHWLIFTEAAQVSADQVGAFRKIFATDARPLEPLNGRQITVDTSP
jgi:carbonic anhydrase